VERFESKVDRSGGPDACHPWTKGTYPNGYGHFYVDGTLSTTSSRFALSVKLGRPLRADEEACHTCDNPPCCNPSHLFEGSLSDNAKDMVAKGRHVAPDTKGENNGMAKLTAALVVSIRESHAAGRMIKHLAEEHALGLSTVGHIVTGRTWRSAPGPIRTPKKRAA